MATLICTAAASASVAFRIHALSTGPAAQLAAENAFITAQIALTDDPKRRPDRSGRFGQDNYVISADLKIIQTSSPSNTGITTSTVGANGSTNTNMSTHSPASASLSSSGSPGVSVASIGSTSASLSAIGSPGASLSAIGSPGASVATSGATDTNMASTGISVASTGAAGTSVATSGSATTNASTNGTASTRQAVDVPITVFATGRAWSSLLPTQHVEVTGRLAKPTPGTLVAATLLVREPPRVLTQPSGLQTAAGALRSGLRSATDVLPPDQGGLLPGLVVGDVSRMDPQVSSDLKEAGLSHLNAVSGANLAIVAGATLALSRVIGLSLPARALFAAVAMLAFTVVARPSPSVLRALLMGLAAAIAMGTGRSKDGFAALSAAVLLLVLFAPELARSYGFALSVTATAGILLLAPRWRDRLTGAQEEGDLPDGQAQRPDPDNQVPVTKGARPSYRWPRWMAEAVAVPVAAQLAVTPVLVLMAGQLTPVAVLANLLVAPAVAPATLLGFGAALVAPVWPDGARLLVFPAGYAVGWIITVARWAVNLPFATVPWPAGLPGLGLLILAVVVAIPILRRPVWRAVALTAAGASLLAALVIRPIAGPWPPKGWLMIMCDVGQGDGLVISAGPGRGVVVDAGPDPVAMDRCLRRVGIEDVPLIVLTHPHADHVGGLPGVLRNRRVGAVVVSPQRAGAGAAAHASATLARHRIPEWTASPGTRWRFGPSELTVLAPDVAHGDMNGYGEGSAINNSSVVLHVRWRPGSILLGGDLETEAQEELLHRLTVRADLLKTPHHGSNRQSPDFLASLGARAALISVGADNDYGHPAVSTLNLLRRLGLTVYRTDRDGDLAVVERSEGGMAVVPRGP